MPLVNPLVRRLVQPMVVKAVNGPVLRGTRGPELVTTPIGTGWTPSTGTVTLSSGKATFTAAAANDNASLAIVTKDSTTYEVIVTMVNRSAGNMRVIVAGATTAHQGVTTSRSADGTYTQQVTTSGAGVNTLKVLVSANAAGSTFEITSVSVKEVLVSGS